MLETSQQGLSFLLWDSTGQVLVFKGFITRPATRRTERASGSGRSSRTKPQPLVAPAVRCSHACFLAESRKSPVTASRGGVKTHISR